MLVSHLCGYQQHRKALLSGEKIIIKKTIQKEKKEKNPVG